MNNIKYLYYFFIILVLLLWFVLTFDFVGIKLNIKELSPVISALAAIINLIFVLTIFKSNKKDKQNDINLSRVSYWYRNVILDRNIDFISEKYSIIQTFTDNLKPENCDQAKLIEVFEGFKKEKRLLIQNVDDMLRILDSSFALKLDSLLDDFEDLYTEKVEDLFSCNTSEWETKKNDLNNSISKYKQKYFKEIYDYEMNGYLLDKK